MSAQTIKTAVSIDRDLFSRGEQLAKALQLTRSGLIAQALEEFITKRRNRAILAKLNQAYAGNPEPARTARVQGMQRRVIGGAW